MFTFVSNCRNPCHGGCGIESVSGAIVIDTDFHVAGAGSSLMDTCDNLDGTRASGRRADARCGAKDALYVVGSVRWGHHVDPVN